MSAPIFTPTDEPYLGRELLFQFDNLICSCLELNSKCAPTTHDRPLSGFQRALCILVPQTISVALSIRELIPQGYLFGAKVLVRPLTERAVTRLYIFKNPDALQVWDDGWKHNKRPTLQRAGANFSSRFQPITLLLFSRLPRRLRERRGGCFPTRNSPHGRRIRRVGSSSSS
jgi:hypothetical protein